jgi:hypothetical protein
MIIVIKPKGHPDRLTTWFNVEECRTGLPDGIVSYPKSQFAHIKTVGMFNGHMEIFTVIWYIYIVTILYILWSFDVFFPVLVCFTPTKFGNPGAKSFERRTPTLHHTLSASTAFIRTSKTVSACSGPLRENWVICEQGDQSPVFKTSTLTNKVTVSKISQSLYVYVG